MDITPAAPSVRKKVILTKQQAQQLNTKAKAFQQEFAEEKAEFFHSQQLNYYIVSTQFLGEWRDYSSTQTLQRYLPGPMNINIVQGNRLKQYLSQGQDFQFLSEKLFKYFKNFQGIPIRRKSIKIGNQKRIPVYLHQYKYMIILHDDLKAVDRGNMKEIDFKIKTIQASEESTIQDFLESIKISQKYSITKCLRLWKVDVKTPEEVFKHIKKQTYPIRSYEYKIQMFGKKITEQNVKLNDLEVKQQQFFIIQVKDQMKKWHFFTDSQGKCQGCYQIAQLKHTCGCKKVSYCTEQCQQKDKRFHLRNCDYAETQQLNKVVQMKITQNSARGKVGLSNLGNTCFMNSCLQCLSNTIPLTQYFIGGFFQNEINKVNPLGTKGKLAKTYAKFIKAMWCDSNSTFSPYNIKNAVSSINPIFSGYAQHDSQQFFSFLVDGLHQDLNRIQKKPYVQSVDSNGRPDKVVALESWMSHIRRNQSIIVDLMTGQYKSKVTCPDCNLQSITFDPFITITLPIPPKSINVSVVSLDQCFQYFRQTQKLQVGNQWFCPRCKDHKLANKQLSVFKAPKILIIHLKRFKQKGTFKKQKNETKVIFPEQLNMMNHLIDPTPMTTYIEEARKANIFVEPKVQEPVRANIQPIYELYAISNHYGGLGGGHYTAYAKNNGKWRDYNDSSVRQVNPSSICGSGAYILFYMRKD